MLNLFGSKITDRGLGSLAGLKRLTYLNLTHAEAVIAELRGVVAELRTRIDAQQAHIHRLVKMTFGRSSERVESPTLFDGLDDEADPASVASTPEPDGDGSRPGHAHCRVPSDRS